MVWRGLIMKTASKNKLLALLALCLCLIFNLMSTNAATITNSSEDNDEQIKNLYLSFSGTCVAGATVDPPDINGRTTIPGFPPFDPFQYEVGTEVHITNTKPQVQCGSIHTLIGDSHVTVVMDSDKYVGFSYYSVPRATPSPTQTPPSTPSPLKGDLDGNGKITSIDFAYMRQWLLGISQKGYDPWVLDIDNDGMLTSIDFAWLRQYLLGLRKL